MRATIILVLLSISNLLHGQSRTIYRRVITEEDADVMPGVHIQNDDKLLLGITDKYGKFKIDIPQNTQTLLFNWIGCEPAIIKLNNDCDTIEVVMMVAGTYDFMSSRKVDKLRLERFNKLPEFHLQAYKKGIFMKEAVCYSREFEPLKPRLDEYEKKATKKKRQIKLAFEKLNIRDTIKIPFAGTYRADGTDRTILHVWSAFTDEQNFDCILKCVILDKNNHKGGYNIVCQVVDCGNCKDPSVYNGRVMKVGEVFDYNMKYFKIFEE